MKADLIVKNAAVYSVKLNGEEIRADAIAVAGDKILYVGTEAEAMKIASETTEIIDAKGLSVIPGLGDGHMHEEGAYSKMMPNINDISPEPEDTPETIIKKYQDRLKSYVDEHPEMETIIAVGWEQAYFNGGLKGIVRILSRKDLDAVCPDRPLLVSSYCGHALWANTKALERAGWLRKDFPDIPGGIIHREPDGTPAGHMTEPAVISAFSNDGRYAPDEKTRLNALRAFQSTYGSSRGMTMSTDMKSTPEGIDTLIKFAKAGEAAMRFSFVYNVAPISPEEDFRYALERAGKDRYEDLVAVDTLKFFIEGEISNLEPYPDCWCDANGHERGYVAPLIWDLEKMAGYVERGVANGFNIHIHALGSNAVREAARMLAKARQAHPDKDVTLTIAHNMSVDDETLGLMAENRIFVNLQPFWMCYSNDIAKIYPITYREEKYGFFPNKVYEEHGIPVAYGSDFPVVCPQDPLIGIGTAVTRMPYPGHKDYEECKGIAYRTEECVSLKQALRAATAGVAAQLGWYGFTGSLEAGKSADFVLLDRNIETADPEEIAGIKVMGTWFKGKKVYSAD